jgi:Phage integrase family
VDRPLPRPQAAARDHPRDRRRLQRSTPRRRSRRTDRQPSARRTPGRLPPRCRVATARLEPDHRACAVSRTLAQRRSTPARRRRSRRSEPGSTRRTRRSSASSPTRASAPARPTRLSGATSSTTAASHASGCASSARSPATRSRRPSREPELFTPVARELVELYLARGRPDPGTLVFPDSHGGHLLRRNWRRRVWIPALERAGVPYFRSYDLRHTCATLLLYEGRTLNEVPEHLGHAEPGFTARTYAHVMGDAPRRRRITISEAIPEGACRRQS